MVARNSHNLIDRVASVWDNGIRMVKRHTYRGTHDCLTLDSIIAAWEADGTLPGEIKEAGPGPEGFLPSEVREADLSRLSVGQLQGRLAYYEREALFERDARIRAENKAEVDRTQEAIDARKAEWMDIANRVFQK